MIHERQVEEWTEALASQQHRMHALADPLEPRQLNWKPERRRWSIGQCIDHLNVSMGVYLDPMEPILEAANRRGGEPEASSSGRGPWIGRFLIHSLRSPGKRYPAPPSFKPRSGDLRPEEVVPEFDRQIGRLRRAVESGDGLALDEIKMPWPVFRWIRLSLAQAFELQVIHIGRHLDQAEGVRRADGFPG